MQWFRRYPQVEGLDRESSSKPMYELRRISARTCREESQSLQKCKLVVIGHSLRMRVFLRGIGNGAVMIVYSRVIGPGTLTNFVGTGGRFGGRAT
jgi:hypothetical protein